jgi:acyl-CoA synthetase (NDP forming)
MADGAAPGIVRKHSAPREAGLGGLFYPRSIAIIGASSDPTKIGGRPLHQLKSLGFAGPIYPINPSHPQVQGITAYPSLDEVPGDIDLAIIAVPLPAVLGAVQACAARGVQVAVTFSAGFAELGGDGRDLQEQIKAAAAAGGMRILGPNCIGAAHSAEHVSATFAFAMQVLVEEGPLPRIALVSQSGAVGGHSVALASRRSFAFDPWVTTGNEADIDVADCVAYLAKDDGVKAIAVYFEGCQDGDRLQAALATAAERGKPVVLLKAGESEIGARAALSHTASLVGSAEAYDALFAKYGICRVATITELVDVSHALAVGTIPAGRRVGILTGSGGMGILAADAAVAAGLDVVPLSDGAQKRLKEIWPPSGVANPIDTTAQVTNDPDLLYQFLETVIKEDFDVIIVLLTYLGMLAPWSDNVTSSLSRIRADYPDANLVVSFLSTPEVQREITQLHMPILAELTVAVRTVASLARIGEALQRPAPAKGPEPAPVPVLALGEPLTERSARAILAEAGVPVLPDVLAESAESAVAAAEKLGYPVVMKVVSPQITHKTEAGGVVLGVSSAAEAAQAYEQIMTAVGQAQPGAAIHGVLVSPMITGGTETILGVKIDPSLGPVVMFGLGGIFVEFLGDVSYRLAPFGTDEAAAMIREVRGFKLLDGARGRPPGDLETLAAALSRLSLFAAANADRLQSIDVNPFIVLPEGQGGFAVDALIVTASPPGGQSQVAGQRPS